MKYLNCILLIILFSSCIFSQNLITKDERINQSINSWVVQSEVSGMTIISSTIPPVEKGCEILEIKNGSFTEILNGWPTGWSIPDLNEVGRYIDDYILTKQRLPQPSEIAYNLGITLGELEYILKRQKKAKLPWKDISINPSRTFTSNNSGRLDIKCFMHFNGKDSVLVKSPDFEVRPGKPHLLSLWVRSKIENLKPSILFWYDAGLEDINIGYNSLPNTDGQWKRVSLYFRVPADMKKCHLTFNFRGISDNYIDVADFNLRTASEDEFSNAYKIERAKMPINQVLRTEEHGKYLSTSIAKLERKIGLPNKPFLIWGVGSSWTNSLDDLEPIRQAIRLQFPNSPEIIYRKRCGSGTPYDFARGWVHNEILSEQPDLIISYTNGNVTSLEKMLLDIRQHSTADIIIPSLHFFENEQLTREYIESPIYDEIKRVCEKYNAQFVDNRRELAIWLIKNKMPITSILSDFVHQNQLGKLLICENIAAHFCRNQASKIDFNNVEKRFYVKNLDDSLMSSNKIKTIGWEREHDNLHSSHSGSIIRFKFIGNRIDLIGLKMQNGGKLKVFIDSSPADKLPNFNISYVKPAITNITHNGSVQHSSKGNADTGPHAIFIGSNVLPQEWTIKMLDNKGNYSLLGSITGFDGNGNSNTLFTSNSGQIIIDPSLWRSNKANVQGDYWTFKVTTSAIGMVDFNTITQSPQLFSLTLAQNLSNEEHLLELIQEGEGDILVNSFYVFTPLIK